MTLLKNASVISTIALLAVGGIGVAGAQTYGEESGANAPPKMSGDRSDFCAQNPDACQPRKMKREQTEVDEDTKINKRKQASNDNWRFDSNRHERRRSRDARFRFFFNGFWYPEPYWLGYGVVVNPRISCGEGRHIVRNRGFNRVRTVECQGRTYTYLGRQHGDDFRVLLNSRTGRVIDIDLV
jgi:hypothetical protein